MPSADLAATLAAPPVLATGEVDNTGVLGSIEDGINGVFAPIAEWAGKIIFFEPIPGIPLLVVWLIVGGIVFTTYFGLPQIKGWRLAFQTVRGKFSRSDDPGEVSHFQALASALSGTIGLGNIAGVAMAVTLGGPGATFWMIVAGLLGMATKFAECTLGVKYREVHADGTVSGGPFKYLKVAFKRFPGWLSTLLVGFFAAAILVFGVAGGNMFQSNQTFSQFRSISGGEEGFLGSAGAGLIFGLVLAGLVALVIVGGIKSIARVTDKLVPGMAIIYVVACLTVLLVNVDQIPGAIGAIVGGAFSPEGVGGGVLAVMFIGFQRAAFSNEAGVGSAPTAHSAVRTRRPVSEGFVALLEPFVDTVIVCTMTALTIVVANTDSWNTARDQIAAGEDVPDIGVTLTSDAFESVISWFPYLLAIAVALFAFSTLITWSYYGQKAWEHLFGRTRTSNVAYKVVFCFFTVLGCVLTLSEVIGFADAALFACAFVNILGVYLLLPVIRREVSAYLADWRDGTLQKYADGEIEYADTRGPSVEEPEQPREATRA